MLTKEKLAEMLNGGAYGEEIDKVEEKMAKDAGLVVVFGYSDDGVEFRGAIHDELGAPGAHSITPEGLLTSKCDEGNECPYFKEKQRTASVILSQWSKEGAGATWTYETTIPHATFEIQSDDEDEGIYCRGLVFALADVPEKAGWMDGDPAFRREVLKAFE